MKKLRIFEINSILKCKYLFYRMPEASRKKQLELHEEIDAPMVAENKDDNVKQKFDGDKIFKKRSLPVMSSDEAWNALSDSEKDLVQSLDYGSLPEAGESYHISQRQNRLTSKKT